MSAQTAILGAAGAIGRAVTDELEKRGQRPVVIGRDGSKLESCLRGRAEIRPADLESEESAVQALRGVEQAVYCAGLPYPQFHRHPVLMRAALRAARRAGVGRMIVVSSVYSYGRPRAERVNEDHPREPEARKGRFRKEQEDAAIGAHESGVFETLVLHLPDFYGPYASNSIAHMMLESLMSGKPARWLGDPDLPHEFVFIPDAARLIVELLGHGECFGRRWNFAGPGAITGRRFAGLAASEIGCPPRVLPTGRWMLRLGGLFSPLLRELVEMQYLGETPVLLDDSALSAALGHLEKTSYEDGVRRMVEWMRSQARAQ